MLSVVIQWLLGELIREAYLDGDSLCGEFWGEVEVLLKLKYDVSGEAGGVSDKCCSFLWSCSINGGFFILIRLWMPSNLSLTCSKFLFIELYLYSRCFWINSSGVLLHTQYMRSTNLYSKFWIKSNWASESSCMLSIAIFTRGFFAHASSRLIKIDGYSPRSTSSCY